MAHRNARLTPLTRLELVREVDAGWPQAEVARHFRVSRHTVAKWLGRFRAEGAAGLEDRSSAPRAPSPAHAARAGATHLRRATHAGIRAASHPVGARGRPLHGLRRAAAARPQPARPPAPRHPGAGPLRARRPRRAAASRREEARARPRGRRQAHGAWLRRDAFRAAFAAFAGAGVPTRRRRQTTAVTPTSPSCPTSVARAAPPSSSRRSRPSAGAACACAGS